MLKMLLQGVPVNYPSDISLNLIYENPFFFNDRIPSSHSLNFTLPATNHNLKLFNRPDRMNSFGSFKEYDGFEIYFGTVRMLSGVLVVQEFERNIKCFFRGSVISDGMRAPLYELPMTYYGFGTDTGSSNLFDPDYWAFAYRELIQDTHFNNSDFCAPVMRIADEPWPYLDQENEMPTGFGNFATMRQYFNFFNARQEQYVLFDGSATAHTVVFPFLRARYIFEVFFNGRLDVNPFASGELQKVVLSSTYHPMYDEEVLAIRRGILLDGYSAQGSPDNYFYLNSFLPSLPANELIRELIKLISATMFPAGNAFSIRTNADILADTNRLDWDPKRINTLTFGKREGQNYAYGYAQSVQPLEEFNGPEVETVDEMYNYPVPPADGEIDVYVQSTQELWTKRLRPKADPADPQRFIFELQGSALGATPDDQGGFDMKPNLEPVHMGIHEYWHENTNLDGIDLGSWYVPEFRGNRFARPQRPQIGLFHGLKRSFSTLFGSTLGSPNRYPLMTAHNYDAYGNRLGDLSLEWEGPDGLLANFHSEYRDYIGQDKRFVRGLFLLNAIDLKNMDLSRKVHLKGMNFFIERINITIRQNKIEPAQVDLVQADL